METPFTSLQKKDTGSVRGQQEWGLDKEVYREHWKPEQKDQKNK